MVSVIHNRLFRLARTVLLIYSPLFFSTAVHAGSIYPWVPLPINEIHARMLKLTEDQSYMHNAFEIDTGHSQGVVDQMPWSGSFWPSRRGMVARPYEIWERPTWVGGYKQFQRRLRKDLNRPDKLSDRQMKKLAPSEKYDLLLGDTSFGLTNTIWDFVYKWGKQKKYGFMTSIDADMNEWFYRRPNQMIGFWEGICHGWAPASILFPRPRRPVTFTLDNGKKLTFFPDDIKAMISLMVANNAIQLNVLMEGYRCNKKRPSRDPYGRYVDYNEEDTSVDDSIDEEIGDFDDEGDDEVITSDNLKALNLPYCADVHPAIWHMSLANLVGKQKRSFVVDKNPTAKIANYPVASYRFAYFNVNSGDFSSLRSAVITRDQYVNDPYQAARNTNAKYIVGVKSEYVHIGWKSPKHQKNDSEKDDKVKQTHFYYDLELDDNYNIVGGQWRTTKTGRGIGSRFFKPKQPDFFWVMPKNAMSYFKTNSALSPWRGNGQAPSDWLPAAERAHAFKFYSTKEYASAEKCVVYSNVTGERKEVECEFVFPKPQPLTEIINVLINKSRGF